MNLSETLDRIDRIALVKRFYGRGITPPSPPPTPKQKWAKRNTDKGLTVDGWPKITIRKPRARNMGQSRDHTAYVREWRRKRRMEFNAKTKKVYVRELKRLQLVK